MTFDWVTLGLQLANVLILLAILRHYLFRPVAGMIAARQVAVQAALAQAEAARTEAAAAAAKAEAEAAATAAARHDLLVKAKAEAEAAKADLLAAAQTEAARIVAEGRAQTATDAKAEAALTLARARDLAETIARRALADMPADAVGWAARLATALSALPERDRAAILSGGNLRLVTAAPLPAAALAKVAQALAPLPPPPVETDAALIAGLEMRSDSGRLRNSLAHDLDRLAEALNG